MPGRDGASLARDIVESKPGLGVLYISGDTPDSIDHLDFGSETAAFLAKPFGTEELARCVRELLDHAGSGTPDQRAA
jgi:DNA-binding response OmpR family regulator